ncbi:UNVERIFIED_CONTAM: hypothetical protein PYX00_004904 [Menopon gallinae]|uniref:Uncharacterized protein n=1 Tax=Menopon gallinae TaxID=328185 RepID=A0AAW2I6H2_9NEOP
MFDFKNDKEAEEYIKRLGVEYRFGCFSEKNPEVCQLLGDYLDAIKKDFEKAGKIYKTNCDEYNFPKSCHSYGNYALVGKGQEKGNVAVAYTYYSKACELGVAKSCLNAGLMDVNGSVSGRREKNLHKGVESLDKACELGNDYACFYLAGIYMTDDIMQRDMKQAFKYSEKACELGSMFACSNLSIMYKKGEGVEKNEEMSQKMKKKADEIREEHESNLVIEFGRGSN